MDPDQLLKDMITLANAVQDGQVDSWSDSADELATNIIDLDHWIKKGGFLPAAWATGRKA